MPLVVEDSRGRRLGAVTWNSELLMAESEDSELHSLFQSHCRDLRNMIEVWNAKIWCPWKAQREGQSGRQLYQLITRRTTLFRSKTTAKMAHIRPRSKSPISLKYSMYTMYLFPYPSIQYPYPKFVEFPIR
jgi:hypothetical protein